MKKLTFIVVGVVSCWVLIYNVSIAQPKLAQITFTLDSKRVADNEKIRTDYINTVNNLVSAPYGKNNSDIIKNKLQKTSYTRLSPEAKFSGITTRLEIGEAAGRAMIVNQNRWIGESSIWSIVKIFNFDKINILCILVDDEKYGGACTKVNDWIKKDSKLDVIVIPMYCKYWENSRGISGIYLHELMHTNLYELPDTYEDKECLMGNIDKNLCEKCLEKIEIEDR